MYFGDNEETSGADEARQRMISRGKPEEQRKAIEKMTGNKKRFYSDDQWREKNKTKADKSYFGIEDDG